MGIKGKTDKMVVLACEDCKERNYTTVKNKKTIKERLELKKYCPRCKSHTTHKETKQRKEFQEAKFRMGGLNLERHHPQAFTCIKRDPETSSG